VRTRDLQKETGGFTEFVGLPFVHMAAPIYLQRLAAGPTFREVVLMHAVARIAYRGGSTTSRESWVKIGLDGTAPAAAGGRRTTSAGPSWTRTSPGPRAPQEVGPDDFARMLEPLGRRLRRRSTLYDDLGPVGAPQTAPPRARIPVAAE
jgi:FO synthase